MTTDICQAYLEERACRRKARITNHWGIPRCWRCAEEDYLRLRRGHQPTGLHIDWMITYRLAVAERDSS